MLPQAARPRLARSVTSARLPFGGGHSEENYVSGEDYVIEFMRYEFRFGARDFEERVTAAAVRLELVPSNELDDESVADLVELTWQGRIAEPRGELGAYLGVTGSASVSSTASRSSTGCASSSSAAPTSTTASRPGCSRSRGTRRTGDFGYAEPEGGRALLELAPTPSWGAVQFRG